MDTFEVISATKRVYNGMVDVEPSEYFDANEIVSPPHGWVQVWNRHKTLYTNLKPIEVSCAFKFNRVTDKKTLHRDDHYILNTKGEDDPMVDRLIRDRGFKQSTANVCVAIVAGIERSLGVTNTFPLEVGILISRYTCMSMQFIAGDIVLTPGLSSRHGGILCAENEDPQNESFCIQPHARSSKQFKSRRVLSSRFAVISPLGIRCGKLYFPYGTILEPTRLREVSEQFKSQAGRILVVRRIVYLHLREGVDVAYNRSQIQQVIPFNVRRRRGDHLRSPNDFQNFIHSETGVLQSNSPWSLTFAQWKEAKRVRQLISATKDRTRDRRKRRSREERDRIARKYKKKSKQFAALAAKLVEQAKEIGLLCDEVLEDPRLTDGDFNPKRFQRDCDQLERYLMKVGEGHLSGLADRARQIMEKEQ